MKKIQTTILIDQDVANSAEFVKTVQQRKLSNLINELLRKTLNIKKIEVSEDINQIEQDITDTKIKLTIYERELENKKEEARKVWEKSDDNPANWKRVITR